VILNEVGVRIIQLNILHVSNIVHDLEFLHQVILHSFLDHVSSRQESSDAPLKNENILFDHDKDITIDLHSEVRLEVGCCLIEAVDLTSNDQPSKSLLKLLS